MTKNKTGKGKTIQGSRLNRISTLLKSETTHFVLGLISIIFSVYLLLAFFSFLTTGAADQSLLYHADTSELLQTDNNITNAMGAQGAIIANYLINRCFGFASFFIIVLLAAVGMKLMRAYELKLQSWFFSCSLILIWLSITLGFVFKTPFANTFVYPGGLHGYNVSNWFVSQIGSIGLALSLLTIAILYIIYIRRDSIVFFRKLFKPDLSKLQKIGKFKKRDTDINSDAAFDEHYNEEYDVEEQQEEEEERDEEVPDLLEEDLEIEQKKPQNEKMDTYEKSKPIVLDLEVNPAPTNSNKQSSNIKTEPTFHIEKTEEETLDASDSKEVPFSIGDKATDEDRAYKGSLSTPYNPRLDLENYNFPALDLLNKQKESGPNIDIEEQNANKERIIKVLRSFGIEISSIKASVGPTITLYEITPAEGVRISKIRNLEDDIALSLSALGIRIIAPIPGQGTIGIEVPNAHPQIVAMHSILNSKKFQETNYELPVALGKTITNEVFMIDLAKAPHMLVAGATGQGKSVGLNAIVTSLLYKKHPAELKFVIIDPKKVEFSVYAP
ncbi:MAG: DNA translocase FtsK 4TM domain-containing protein, partial [Phocaeicola sp.]